MKKCVATWCSLSPVQLPVSKFSLALWVHYTWRAILSGWRWSISGECLCWSPQQHWIPAASPLSPPALTLPPTHTSFGSQPLAQNNWFILLCRISILYLSGCVADIYICCPIFGSLSLSPSCATLKFRCRFRFRFSSCWSTIHLVFPSCSSKCSHSTKHF